MPTPNLKKHLQTAEANAGYRGDWEKRGDELRPQFGTANVPAPTAHMRRLIGPKDLPSKGIAYNLNHLRRMWKRGAFPPPVYTSKRRFSWPEEVIDRWIDEKIAASVGKVA